MFKRLAGILAVGVATLTTPATAQEIVLKIADTLPANHNVYKYGLSKFMEDITAASDGAITFEYYPAQQLGKIKDMLTLVQTGVVDIALVSPGQVSEKLPYTTVAELPGLYSSSCEGTEAFLKATHPGGLLYEREIKNNKMHALIAYMYQPYDVLTAKKKIETQADWKGMKLRTAGGPTELSIGTLGAVSVRTAPSDMYESVSRGTVDGVMVVSTSARAYNLDTVVKYVTTGFQLGSSSATYMISDASWDRLSPEHQEILRKAGEDASRNLCAETDRLQTEELEKFEAQGIEVTRVTEEQQRAWSEQASSVFENWATQARLDTAAAAEFRAAVTPE
jgi:TRAP-type C4-dicarboxylate transport system substrate-binding protein